MAAQRHIGTTQKISTGGDNPLQINVTEGAPAPSSDYAFHPCNWVHVFGQHGLTVNCTLGAGGAIVDGDGNTCPSAPYVLTLDQFGKGKIRVATTPDKAVTFTVYVEDADDIENIAFAPVIFANYRVGVGAIQAYAYTTGAAADGEAPCTLYVIVDRTPAGENPISIINVTLDPSSSAVLQNAHHPKSQNFPLNPDGSVAVGITDTVAEDLSVTVYLPESGNSDALDPFTVQFVTFPKG